MPANENAVRSLWKFAIGILLAIILVYLVMVALYNSYLHRCRSFLIAIGSNWRLSGTGPHRQLFEYLSMIGMIIADGVGGQNAILLVDFTNQCAKKAYK
jgi:HAE1 family hydrophobic/amphiphilic exporter-1